MRRRLSYIFAAIMSLCGCVDDSYHGTPDSLYGDDSVDIPVIVALGDPVSGIVKGAGAIDKHEEWDGSSIYVYAFAKDADVSYKSTSSTDPLCCLVDGSKDKSGSKAGKKASLDAMDYYAIWEKSDVSLNYPSGENKKSTYDFFAYYLDDIQVNESEVRRRDDAVVLDVEIDGTQDLMSSKAAISPKQLGAFSEREQAYLLENQYSYYTAQRDIVPAFVFKHHLVRLEFEIHAGVMLGDTKNLTIHGLEVESKCNAFFTVASKSSEEMGLVFKEKTKIMPLTEDGGAPLNDGYIVNVRPSPATPEQIFKLGGCLLVAPSMEYDAYIIMSERTSDGTLSISRGRTPITISYPSGGHFQGGNQYKVKLVIYSANNVSASVEMQPWHHGGDINMDMENDKPIL